MSVFLRPVLALLIFVFCVGSVQCFMLFVDSVPAQEALVIEREEATGRYDVEITLSFDAVADEFTGGPAGLLRYEDRVLFESKDRIVQGEAVRIDDVKVFKAGAAEIYFSFACNDEDLVKAKAVRIVIQRDSQTIFEKTSWAQPGDPVEGTVNLKLEAQSVDSGGERDHRE